MRKAAWRRWAAVSGATLALAALAVAPALSAETTRESTGSERAWLGVYTQALTSELREGLNYKGQGVLVNRVIEDSPADRAGVQKGDVIISYNSRSIDSPEALANLVGQGKNGQSASLRVVRGGQTKSLTVKLAGRTNDEGMDESSPDRRVIHIHDHDLDSVMPNGDMDLTLPGVMRWMGRGRLGVRVETLNPDLAGYFSVPNNRGVLVVEVMKDTPADKAGLKAGDVITRVGGQEVSDAGDLVQALGHDEGKVSLDVIRKGARRTIDAQLEHQERTIRIRRGDGSMRLNDERDRVPRGGQVPPREIEELRRQIEELRRQLERLQHN